MIHRHSVTVSLSLFRYGQDPDDFEYAMSEFLRMNGMYWGVACMDLIDRLHEMDRYDTSRGPWGWFLVSLSSGRGW